MALPRDHVWTLAAVTVACYTALLFFYVPLPGTHALHDDAFQLHVVGMWLVFLLSASLIAWFSVKMNATLRERDRLAAEMREQALRHERVLALGTLAAGAAHELGTPLATLAVLPEGCARRMNRWANGGSRPLRDQVGRCKEILSSLTAQTGRRAPRAARACRSIFWLREILDRNGARCART